MKLNHQPKTLAIAASISAVSLLLASCASPPAATAGADRAPSATAAAAPLAEAPTLASRRVETANAADVERMAAEEAREKPILIYGTDRLMAPGAPVKVPTGPSTTFKFEDAPAAEVAHVLLRDILKVDYVVYPPLPGTITLTTRGPVTPDKAMLLLENALQVNGIVIARDTRGTYHVGKAEALRGIVSVPQVAGRGPLGPGYGAVIYPLQYLGAAEMASILRPMVPAEAIVRVDTVRNILVMQGTRSQAEGWNELVNMFDVNMLRGMSVGVFPLKHTTAADVDAALRILSGSSATLGATASGRQIEAATRAAANPSPTGAQGAGGSAASGGDRSPLFGALRVFPIERINAVLVVTPRAAYLDEVRYWIEQFDRPSLNSGEPQLFVYKVQNGSADHLAELMNGIYGGSAAVAQPSATGVAPGLTQTTAATAVLAGGTSLFGSTQSGTSGMSAFGAGRANQNANTRRGAQTTGGNLSTVTLGQNVRVMADRINNTLLVHAPPGEYERMEKTLRRLDVQRAQILIEASIVEVTLRDELSYGLQWTFKGAGIGSGSSGTGTLSTTSGGVLAAAGTGFSYAVRNAGGTITALLETLATKSLVKVISSPSLMVLDNHTASIAVGDQQPVNTGSVVTSTGTVIAGNIQYKDTGVMLDVTPSVNAGDLVTLDINQSVIDVGDTIDAATGQRAFLQRQLNSKVAVRSGETLVLGGLIKDNTSRGKSGLPVLSAIPVLGALFGQHDESARRTELLVVLTPRVIRSDEDARAVSRELRDRMRGLVGTEQLR